AIGAIGAKVRILSLQGTLAAAPGPYPGLTATITTMVKHKRRASTMPGIKPAISNLPIDSSVRAPYRIISVLGGINIPRPPPATIEPDTSFWSYLVSSISFDATTPIVPVVARLDPDEAAKNAEATTDETARPPRMRPNQARIAP